MIKLGSQEVTKIMKGSEEVLAVYKDGDELWAAGSDELYFGTEALSGNRECYWTTSAPDFPTDSFTVETWFKSFGGPNHGAYASLFGAWKYPSANGWMFGFNMDGQEGGQDLAIMHRAYDDTYAYGKVPGNNPLDGWNHVAFVKQGSTIYIYINGVRKYSFSDGGFTWGAHTRFYGPGAGVRAPAYGTFSNYRVSNNARYKSGATFTPPSGPFVPDSKTLILSHCGDEIKDYSDNNTSTSAQSGLKVTEDTPWTPKVRVRKDYEEWGPIELGNTDIDLEDSV